MKPIEKREKEDNGNFHIKQVIINVVTIAALVLVVWIMLFNIDGARAFAVRHMSNTKVMISDKYEDDNGIITIVLSDTETKQSITIQNDDYFKNYKIGDYFRANKYITISENGIEKITYNFETDNNNIGPVPLPPNINENNKGK